MAPQGLWCLHRILYEQHKGEGNVKVLACVGKRIENSALLSMRCEYQWLLPLFNVPSSALYRKKNCGIPLFCVGLIRLHKYAFFCGSAHIEANSFTHVAKLVVGIHSAVAVGQHYGLKVRCR